MDEYGNTRPVVDLVIEESMIPMNTALRSNFITARAAARQMLKQGSGVIIFLTGSPHGRTSRVRLASAPPTVRSRISRGQWQSNSAQRG